MQSFDRLAIGAIGSSPDFKSRVFHDIWLLDICLETLFSSASNNPNSFKSFHTTAPPHVVPGPMYFKCSVHQRALKTVSGNTRLQQEVWHFLKIFGHPKFLWQLKKIIKVWGICHLEFKIFLGSSPRPPPPRKM